MQLTIKEAAERRGVSEARIKQYIAAKRLAAHRIGARMLLVNSEDLDNLFVWPNGRPPEYKRKTRKT